MRIQPEASGRVQTELDCERRGREIGREERGERARGPREDEKAGL